MNFDVELAALLGTTRIEFTVPGIPVVWARTQGHGGVRFTAPKQRAAKGVLVTYMEAAMNGAPPFEGPVRLDMLCVFPCPKGRYRCPGCGKKHGRPDIEAKCLAEHGDRGLGARRDWYPSKCDRDNLLKLVQDAGNGILYFDDRQICAGEPVKAIAAQGEPPFTKIVLSRLGDYEDLI